MQIPLNSSLEAIIREQLESGRFRDAVDVIEQALALLVDREVERERLLESIKEGFAELDRGEGVEYTAELRKKMFQSAIRRARAGEMPHPDVCP